MQVMPGRNRWAITPVYSAPCCHHSADGGDPARRDYWLSLPAVSALPEVDYPHHSGRYPLSWRQPDVVTSAITAPLERQFGQMSGLKQMSSQSSGGGVGGNAAVPALAVAGRGRAGGA